MKKSQVDAWHLNQGLVNPSDEFVFFEFFSDFREILDVTITGQIPARFIDVTDANIIFFNLVDGLLVLKVYHKAFSIQHDYHQLFHVELYHKAIVFSTEFTVNYLCHNHLTMI